MAIEHLLLFIGLSSQGLVAMRQVNYFYKKPYVKTTVKQLKAYVTAIKDARTLERTDLNNLTNRLELLVQQEYIDSKDSTGAISEAVRHTRSREMRKLRIEKIEKQSRIGFLDECIQHKETVIDAFVKEKPKNNHIFFLFGLSMQLIAVLMSQ